MFKLSLDFYVYFIKHADKKDSFQNHRNLMGDAKQRDR